MPVTTEAPAPPTTVVVHDLLVLPRLVQLPGLSTTQVLQAVLSVLPLDSFDSPCAWTMQVVRGFYIWGATALLGAGAVSSASGELFPDVYSNTFAFNGGSLDGVDGAAFRCDAKRASEISIG